MQTRILSDSVLSRIVERTQTLDERLSEQHEGPVTPDDSALADRRWERWRAVAADGDDDVLRRRLALDGLDESTVRAVLGTSETTLSGEAIPGWALRFRELLEAALTGSDRLPFETDASGFIQPETPYPFEDLLAPIVSAASARLAGRVDLRRLPVAAEALKALERALLRRLARASAECLYVAFNQFRIRRTSSFGRLLAAVADTPDTALYRAFVRDMLSGEIVGFFECYPCLARLMAGIVEQWIDGNEEFLIRLERDWPALRKMFGQEPGELATLRSELSDPHNGGRTTLLLTFASGHRLVYKPRNLDTEEHWFALLGWLNAQGLSRQLRCLRVINRESYGWVEFAEHQPCRDQSEARDYYQRTGMLLALVYTLGGNDCHFENIIASGDQPMLVDLETIMHPIRRDGDQAGGALQRVIGRERFESVIRTGMLPQWVPQSGGRALDTSALGAVNEIRTTRPQPTWREINTDTMRLEWAHMTIAPGANASAVGDRTSSPNDFVRDIEAGFTEMYRLLVAQRERLLAPDGAVTAMRRQHLRFIHRGTGIYYTVLERANHPETLRDGIARSIELDLLARPLLQESEQPRFWPLVAIERAALERGDIPYVVVAADDDGIMTASGDRIEDCLDGSCFDHARARLLRLDDRDLARQLGYIRATMQARVARHDSTDERETDERTWSDSTPLPDAGALVDEARGIAEQIRHQALGDAGSGIAWMTVRFNFQMQRFHLEISGPSLYDGACGIALFLAAVDLVCGTDEHRETALAALLPLRQEIRSAGSDRLGREVGIGGASGIGSFVYGLTRTGVFLQEPALIEDAKRAAALISPELIEHDRVYDVIGGAAGAILGLLALYRECGDALALDRATACGRHLLEHRVAGSSDFRAWPGRDGRPLAGFAHGAAGIAYALLMLAGATGGVEFRDASEEAIAYESSLFSSTAQNWPDLRYPLDTDDSPEYAISWCNGGSGIGLARLGGLAVLDTPAIRADIERAVGVIRGAATGGADHLCCGHLGRADILLELGQSLDRPEYMRLAMSRIADRRARAQHHGGYRLFWDTSGGVSLPGMFQGSGGIGYTLLRAAAPQLLPSILLWA